MAEWHGPAILCAVRPHAENGAIARLLTADQGLIAGYVRGGQSRRLAPVLMPGNRVATRWYARTPEQLGHLTLELDRPAAAAALGDPLCARALEWATAITAASLAEGHAYPLLYEALDGLVVLLCLAPDPRAALGALVRYELVLLAELGFGLDLTRCAVTGGGDDLAYVSPKSGRAVNRAAAAPWLDKLLPLPGFLVRRANDWPDWAELAQGLALSGYFIERELVPNGADALRETRVRLASAVAAMG
ncbi:MAG: DNA repair protein RecO [Sphingomonadales bacterium]|nr:MAG: DNA repair protein RecO [Sphingomonadales bacterium]